MKTRSISREYRFHRMRPDRSRSGTWKELGEPRGSRYDGVGQVTRIETCRGLTNVHRTRDQEGHRPPKAILGLGSCPDLGWGSGSWFGCQSKTLHKAVWRTNFHPKGFPGMQWGQGCAYSVLRGRAGSGEGSLGGGIYEFIV